MSPTVLQSKLTRGTPVVVAESYKDPALRGATQVVASHNTVKCNGGKRCAGPWCVGEAVFLTPQDQFGVSKDGWRAKTRKICTTHLKDENGNLLVQPPAQEPPTNRVQSAVSNGNGHGHDEVEVTWEDLAKTHAAGDLEQMTLLARRLKTHNDALKSRVIEAQQHLISTLSS